MANLYKPTYKQVNTKTGEGTVRKGKKWYARYRDETGTMRREALASDKRVAQAMLDKILRRVEQAKAGIVDPLEEQSYRPFAEHLGDYKKHMKQKDDSPRHIRDTCVKIKKMAKAAKWRRVADILATDVQAYLAELADKGLGIQTRTNTLKARKPLLGWFFGTRRFRTDPLFTSHYPTRPSTVATIGGHFRKTSSHFCWKRRNLAHPYKISRASIAP